MRVYRWYVFAISNGIPVASGPHNTESDAQEAIAKIKDIDGVPEFRRYRTVQLSEAKKMFKYEMAQKTGSMGLALRPIKAKKSKKEDVVKGVFD